ncbi:hypothetical protein CASFOL_013156 [Castilleja foliolosa]|uniref:NB-ARC domain-containing protein n=1 Tax=Castilleja foliolosa TaxID=1961234 RepID=A0ABD3DNA4_9LAMI
MAAYDALVSLLQTVDTILIPSDLPISLNTRQLKSLREKLIFLQHYLLENNFTKTGDLESLKRFESRISDAAIKAENLIESHISGLLVHDEDETRKVKKKKRKKHKKHAAKSFFHLPERNTLFFLVAEVVIFILVINLLGLTVPVNGIQNVIFDAVHIIIYTAVIVYLSVVEYEALQDGDLCRVTNEFGSIVKMATKIKDANRPITIFSPPVDDYSAGKGNNDVVGFDNDLTEIKTRLICSSPRVEAVSIVGMGGIGKTTLARQAYDDKYVVEYFDTRAWVTVSQEYSIPHVLLSLLQSAGISMEYMSEKSEGQLSECLYKSLKGRRYLIVMDDTWDTKIWDELKRSFPEDNNTSRVLLTTRLLEVALYSNPSIQFLHPMRFFNESESWDLLCRKVFGGKGYCPDELEEVGKAIARYCEGLPLAIAVIGGVLSKVNRTREHWTSIADNLSSIVTKDDEMQCMEILSLSYNHLPHHLRPCFLYMGVFPEDCEISIPKLVRLWVAEGFLKPIASKSLEELAEEYLDDLFARNLLLVCKWNRHDGIKTCIIHDMLRNLCIQKAHDEKFLHVVKRYSDVLQEGANASRRLSIHANTHHISEVLSSGEIRNSSARSLLCTGAHRVYPSRVYLGYKLLRVLDLLIVQFSQFPVEITRLVNLRYLALTYNGQLPPLISKLQNLQTIVYHNFEYDPSPFLPVEIWMMPKLRHICVTSHCFNSQVFPDNCFLLENLQTLSDIMNLRCDNDFVKKIPNLKKLVVSYGMGTYMDRSLCQLEALANLNQLETLKLRTDYCLISPGRDHPKLAFPQKLKRLSLTGCGMPWESMTVVGALPNLEVLKLINACRSPEWDPVEGQFCQLKYLLLEDTRIVHWRADQTHFPRLERLVIRSCSKLMEIPLDIGEIPTLQTIELVGDNPPAVTMSAKRIEEEQQSMGNEDLKVHFGLKRVYKFQLRSRVLH